MNIVSHGPVFIMCPDCGIVQESWEFHKWRQTDRQTDRQTHTHTHTHAYTHTDIHTAFIYSVILERNHLND